MLFAKPDLVVLYDDLAAKEPATFQFMLHAHRPFEMDEKEARLSVDLPKAGADVRYLSPVPLAFRSWDGYDPKPTSAFPNMWHVEAGTREKRAEVGMLTAIVPYRAGRREAWTTGRIESDTAVGLRFERGGRTVRVAFRKDGVRGPASVDGITFDGPAAVR